MNPFHSLREYEDFVYTLQTRYPAVERSTLVIARRGKRVAVMRGELTFARGHRLTVQERLSLDTDRVVIEFYGYELWRGTDKLAWYDAQPHPHVPELQSTHPHHKHVPPDIKRNRIPAPQMRFAQPNLSVLIAEMETLVEQAIDEAADGKVA